MYKVKFGGKKGKEIKLVESKDKVVVRTKGNKELEDVEMSESSRELLQESAEIASFPEAGVTVHKVGESDSELALQKRDETRAALKTEEEIRFAGRVLEEAESGEFILYTENFFVKFFDPTPEKACLDLLKKYNLEIKNALPFAENAYFVCAGEGTGLEIFELAEKLLEEKEVEYCHPEMVQERRYKGRHPLQWHLGPAEINGRTIDAHVNIEEAWSVTKGNGTTIAVIDDGFDMDHPEFAGRIVHPFDATLNNHNPIPQSPSDNHGTACAGMACASGLEGGASGTAPQAQFMPIRLRSGLGSMAEAAAFVWAADHGADVISCSWGPSDGEWWNPDDPKHKRVVPMPDSTRLAMEYAIKKGRAGKGCSILFAAGNGNEDISTDGYASYPGVIAVAACNDSGRRSVYSDFGEAIWVSFPSGDFGWQAFEHPDPLSAGLRTTDRMDADGYDPGDYVNSFKGTSGACPGMAGVVALMLAANPNLRSTQVKELIKTSCQLIDLSTGDYNNNGHSKWYGYGRIDAGMAVKNALETETHSEEVFEGHVWFKNKDVKALPNAEWVSLPSLKRIIGLQIKPLAGFRLEFEYSVQVPNIGVSHSGSDNAYAGTIDRRRRIVGFAIEMGGPDAGKFTIEYAAKFHGRKKPLIARNGEWCGFRENSAPSIEGILVAVRKK